VIIGSIQTSYGQAVQSLPSLYPHKSTPFNVTMEKWLENYWNWFGSTEGKLLPRNGGPCGINQNGPVWFLDFYIPQGGAKNNPTQNCEIPEGKAIFIPSHVGEVDQSERPKAPYTDKEITDSAKDGNNGGHVRLSIDGREFFDGRHITSPEDYSLYRTITDFFNLTYVEGNNWGVPAGTYRAQADGYFSIVQPLAPGKHTIFLHSDTTQGEESDKYIADQLWNIIIKRTSNSTS
jgi:hypothetical protein